MNYYLVFHLSGRHVGMNGFTNEKKVTKELFNQAKAGMPVYTLVELEAVKYVETIGATDSIAIAENHPTLKFMRAGGLSKRNRLNMYLCK